MASKAESRLRNRIVKAIRTEYVEDLYVFHPHGSQFSSGAPDLVGCIQGRFFGLEVKMPTNKRGATKLQQEHLDAITEAGGIAAVVTSPQEAKKVLLDGIT